MKNLIIKIVLPLIASSFMTGCVLSPDGMVYAPTADATVDVGLTPRVHVGTRANVSVWLHPNFVVADAYPIAQAHCNRWGLFARPVSNWTISVTTERYLNYNCVSYRPVLAFPHIIVDHGRYYRRPWHRRWYRRTYGRHYDYRRPHRRHVPRTMPRRTSPRRNGWWSRSRNRTEVGKPWEHNRRKRGVFNNNPRPRIERETGKPWEHNRRKKGIFSRSTTVKTGAPWSKKTITKKTVSRPWGSKNTLEKKTISKRRGGFGNSRVVEKKTLAKYKKPGVKKTVTKKTITKKPFSSGRLTNKTSKSINTKKSVKKKAIKKGTWL